jgi:hypothetical protein
LTKDRFNPRLRRFLHSRYAVKTVNQLVVRAISAYFLLGGFAGIIEKFSVAV